jgi:cell division septation protein DedD
VSSGDAEPRVTEDARQPAGLDQARLVSTAPVTAAQPPATDTTGQAGTAATGGDPTNVPRIKPEDIQSLARSATPPPTATQQPAASRQPAAPLDLTARAGQQAPAQAPRQPASAGGAIPAGAYVVQVSSQRTEEQAQAAFNDLQRRFGSVLGGVSPVIQRADLGDRGTFFRVRIPTASRDDAISLCERLKTAGGDCFVRRN